MQWLILLAWLAAILLGTRSPRRIPALRQLLACALALSMGLQLLLLYMDGLLYLETALPLHLCGLFGVLSIPALWRMPAPLWEASAFLGAPAAFLTLFFPAVIQCSHPVLMKFAFCQLHVLIALMPLYHLQTGKPLPSDPRRTLIMGNGYLLLVSAFNHTFSTNYLFLRAAPAGTPLAPLFARGLPFYICSLEMLCMLVFLWLQHLFVTAGNSSSCSRYNRHTVPCTSRDRV